MELDLTEATWTDIADHEGDVALLPVGSTEQHGPHAPLGTDAFTARAVAAAGAAAYEERVPVAPTISVGVAAEHRQFDGTLWVSPATFRAYVGEVIDSLAQQGYERVIVVNGHGGNVGALAECCGERTRTGEVYAVPFTWFEAIADSDEMGHGGPIETALLRAIRPDLVREDRIERTRAEAAPNWGEWVSGVDLAVDSIEFSRNGAVGDPGTETENGSERGEELLAEAARALVALLEAIAERELPLR